MPAEDKNMTVVVQSALKDLLIGLGIGVGLYVLFVIAHSILFGLG